MATLQIGPRDTVYYEHTAPTDEVGCTFVFFNALTGDTGMWEAVVAPKLREAGHGTLAFNFRGQANSSFSPGTKIDAPLIEDDAMKLMAELKPARPVLVGLSIGGLFAANAYLKGAEASGLIFVNTLRRGGARLKWINEAMVRCIETGGFELLRDLFFPLLFNEDWLDANRPNFLGPDKYPTIDKNSGHYNLMANSVEANWDIPYEKLILPTLVITGLQDHIFLDRTDIDNLFARLPDSRKIDFPDAGHMIPLERPEAFTKALLDFAGDLS